MVQFLPVDEVHVLSTYVESMLYGAFFIMYMVCIWVLVKRSDPSKGVNKLMLTTATAMLIVATLFEAVSIQRDVEAFFEHKDGNPNLYYAVASNFSNLYQSALFQVQVLIGDALLIYRMYIVYERRFLAVAFPIAMWIGCAVCGSMVIFQFSLLDAAKNPSFFAKSVAPWTTSNTALTMSQNAISTLAIAVRLWWVGGRAGKWFSGRLWRSATVFLESGFPYTLTLVIFTVLHLRDQDVYDFAYYGIVPMAGISMTSLIIRVGIRRHEEFITSNNSPYNIPYHYKNSRSRHVETMVFSDPTRTQGTNMSTSTNQNTLNNGHFISTAEIVLDARAPIKASPSKGSVDDQSATSDDQA